MQYRAFLSYSHADTAFAEAFHKDLERWRADRGLIGRKTERGEVPRDLRPIFRDRDDFAGGRTLREATLEALEASDFLILLCSPDAARSAYVNEEVRSFKALGGAGRIIPVIIAGEPGPGAETCFPEALIRKVGPDGELTDEPEEPLAADAREQGDGPRRALAKVIAGLLGVPFDEIVRRAEQAQRRRNRVYAAVATMMTILAVAAGAFGWLAETRRVAADRNYKAAMSAADGMLGQIGEELIRTEGVGIETTKRLLGRSEAIYDELMISLPDAVEIRERKIAALGIFSRAYFAKGDAEAADEALAEAERLAEITFDASPQLAILRTERAKLLTSAGDYDEAAALYRQALDVLMEETYRAAWTDAEARLAAGAVASNGLLLTVMGRLEEAEAALAEATSIADAWRPVSDHERDWLTLENAALAAGAQIDRGRGNLAAARDKVLRSVAGAEAFLARNPDLAGLRTYLGEMLREAGDLSAALGFEDEAAAYAARADAFFAGLAAADLENVAAQIRNGGREVSRAIERIDAGEAEEAAPQLTAALTTLEARWRAAPGDVLATETARFAFDVAAGAFNRSGYHREALAAARFLIELETAADDEEAETRLMLAHARAMTAEQSRENYGAALVHAEAALDVERRLTAADPTRRRRLANAEWASGQLLWYLSRRAEAEVRYARVVDLFTELVAEAPDDIGLGKSLSWTCVNLGELKALNGAAAGARAAFRSCLANAERIFAAVPTDRGAKLDLAWAAARVALIDNDMAGWRRVETLLSESDAEEPLADLEDELLTVARIAIAGQ